MFLLLQVLVQHRVDYSLASLAMLKKDFQFGSIARSIFYLLHVLKFKISVRVLLYAAEKILEKIV